MGRAKSKMELIVKEKDRNSRFQIRKKSLKKKVHELATLCGIKAMVIIYGPKQATPQASPIEPEIFPDNRDEVLELINKYQGQSPEDRKKRTYLLSDFFQDRNKKLQEDLNRLRKDNIQSKYPTTDSRFDSLTEKDLRRIADFVEKKIEIAKGQLEQMKANNNSKTICSSYYYLQQQQQQQRMLTKTSSMDFEGGNQPKYILTLDPHQTGAMRVPIPMPMPVQQQIYPLVDHYQNERMIQFGNDFAGGALNNVYNVNQFNNICNYPPVANTVNSMTYVNNLARAPPNYYGGDMQPRFMDYHPGGTGLTHQMVATSHQANDQAQFYEGRRWQS